MPSPFPGMDPFLELPAYWSDFHIRFMNVWCEAIAEALPADYEATLVEREYLAEIDTVGRKLGFPAVVEVRETHIEIMHHPDRHVVAILKMLSPDTKQEPIRVKHIADRREFLLQDVSLVELDLLLGGALPWPTPLPEGDYYCLVYPSNHRPWCRLWPLRVTDGLPVVPVPLRAPDADIAIYLAAVFATAYERGRFGRRLPYLGPLPPHLPERYRAWAESVIRGPRSA